MYSTEQLNRIQKLAASFVSIREIAVVMDLDGEMLKSAVADPDSEIGKAYRKGKTQTIVALKEQETQLALMGSPAAVQAVRDYLIDMQEDEY